LPPWLHIPLLHSKPQGHRQGPQSTTQDESRLGERIAEAAALRAAVAASVSITDNWWDTPAGRRQYVQLRLEGFDKDLVRFDRFGIEPWTSTYDGSSGQWTVQDIDVRSKELKEATSGVIDFIEWLLNVKAGEDPSPPQDVDVQVRLERIQQIATRVRPRIIEVTTGEVLDIFLFAEVLQDLSEVRALATNLHD
jgi:hypothetical protein